MSDSNTVGAGSDEIVGVGIVFGEGEGHVVGQLVPGSGAAACGQIQVNYSPPPRMWLLKIVLCAPRVRGYGFAIPHTKALGRLPQLTEHRQGAHTEAITIPTAAGGGQAGGGGGAKRICKTSAGSRQALRGAAGDGVQLLAQLAAMHGPMPHQSPPPTPLFTLIFSNHCPIDDPSALVCPPADGRD
jgi:hypothetical protein